MRWDELKLELESFKGVMEGVPSDVLLPLPLPRVFVTRLGRLNLRCDGGR